MEWWDGLVDPDRYAREQAARRQTQRSSLDVLEDILEDAAREEAMYLDATEIADAVELGTLTAQALADAREALAFPDKEIARQRAFMALNSRARRYTELGGKSPYWTEGATS